ncbi:hypothetical protein MKW98_002018 [Papaver atlanticum]|uniref:Uncharacterized protein n=1 Tax=Papaver atlanticum TaxID=357466 RepID=A0AAD4SNQ7_9MAGN|nr:hypothetical protein MKW98_002018 [Papaver atlanticum]
MQAIREGADAVVAVRGGKWLLLGKTVSYHDKGNSHTTIHGISGYFYSYILIGSRRMRATEN